MNRAAVLCQRIMGGSILGIAICCLSLPSQAITVRDVPNPRQTSGGWVTDSAQILKPETEAQLNQMINQLEATNGAEIAVVTVPETKPAATPKVFATELFNYWHIGKKGQDNGVLFLISKGDRRVEIETGYGVEAILPDAKVGNIIDTKILPRFKQSDYDGGTLAGTKALVMVLEGQEPQLTGQEPQQDSTPAWFGIWIAATLALGVGGTGVIIYKLLGRPVYLKPEGQSRTQDWHQWFEKVGKVYCRDCRQPLQPVEPALVTNYLTAAQHAAERIGSTQFVGWKCPNCNPDKLHIRAYETTRFGEFSRCPFCDELTVIQHGPSTIRKPQFLTPGLQVTTYQCQCCNYSRDVETEIPSYIAGGSSSSDGGGGSSGGGGSDFGGGSSGGGGAGGSW